MHYQQGAVLYRIKISVYVRLFGPWKYLERGYHINAGQYVKMCFQLNELDLKDVKVLEDQLTGVDTAYFKMMVDAIQKHMEENR